LKFPSAFYVCKDSFIVEAWDNNVITQMQLKSCDTNVMEYYAGVDSTSMVKYDLPELAAVVRKLEQLKVSKCMLYSNSYSLIKSYEPRLHGYKESLIKHKNSLPFTRVFI
jgi:hypothetical protein